MKNFEERFLMSLIFIFIGAIFLSACNLAAPGGESALVEAKTAETAGMPDMGDELPSDLDTATVRLTEGGHYRVSITSNMEPVVINQIHSWTLHLETPDGRPVENAEIVVAGGMPQHDHGFPTSPQVTQELGQGDYLIEGVKFNMTGWWEMRFDINAGGQHDRVVFNLVVETGAAQG